ncbi:aminoacyl-tRNA hydrolase [Cryomorphaceae bacterium]|nr:aminoacyl-tRNA hydrolase [Cryomorphaceae bacterium]
MDKKARQELRQRNFAPDFEFTTSRSSGPGGQHANKTETRVTLRFSVEESEALRADEKPRVLKAWRRRLTESGELLLSEEGSRSQVKNKEAVVKRFFELLEKALTPRKKRIPTQKSRAAKLKQVQDKKRRGEIKKMRQKPPKP